MTTQAITREQEAGKLYSAGLNAVRVGGLELHSLALHLIMMTNGTSDFSGPMWPVRELNDGSIRQLDRFIDYLLQPARDGLGLPSLYFLKRTLEATIPPKDGDEALRRVRAELAKEHVDFDKQAKLDGLKMHGERDGLAAYGANQHAVGVDNVNSLQGGNAASYLAARLRRSAPEIADRLARGEFRSVRAAAIAAGIITPLAPLQQIQKLWAKLDADGRKEHLEWTLKQCAVCGRSGAIDGTWCDDCCEEGAREGAA